MKKEDVTLEKEFGQAELEFQAINGKRLSVSFDEPEITSDAGLLAVSQFEKEMGLIKRLAGCVCATGG